MRKLYTLLFALIVTIGMSSPGFCKTKLTEIRIGVINSMTGNNVHTGSDQKWAYTQAAKDINAKGGLYLKEAGKKLPVKLIFRDDESTPGGASAAMEQLIKVDKVPLILGSNEDKLNNAGATVADKYKIYYCSGGGWWGDDYVSQHFKWGSDMFFTAAGAAEVPYEIWNTLPKKERPTRVAIMTMNILDGHIFAKGLEAAAKKFGYKVVDVDAYTIGQRDFSSSILRMRNDRANALLWLGSPPDGITLMRNIKAQNFNLKYIHGWMGFWPTEYAKTLGPISNYTMCDGFWSPELGTPGSQKLEDEYKADHNGSTSVSVGMYYSVAQVLFKAIERAGTLNSAKVRSEVWNGTFKGTMMGTVTYKNGYCETPSLGLQWYNQKRHLVWPTGISSYKYKPMPPWSKR